jgi:hypothetical protein
MDAHERTRLPNDLLQARARFQAWRPCRHAGDRIPRPLWASARNNGARPHNALNGVALTVRNSHQINPHVSGRARQSCSR